MGKDGRIKLDRANDPERDMKMSDILQNDKMQETEERRTVSEIAAQMETEEELTGENNPMNRMEKGTDTRNPIIKALERFGDLFALNLTFILSCIPVITIGASVTALFTMTNKMVRNEDGTMWKGFWKAFGQKFKVGTKVWAVILAYLGVVYAEYAYMIQSSGQTTTFMVVLIGLEMVFLSLLLPFLFPIIARYENTIINYIKNTVIISVANFKTWLVVFIIWFVPALALAASAVLLAYTWYLWLLVMFSVQAYATSMILQKVFDKLEEAQTEQERSGV